MPAYLDYVGHIESILKVDITARVKGYLEKRLFVEGDDVKAKSLLYQIEQRGYQAKLDEARAALHKAEARATDAKLEEERYLMLLGRQSTSKSEYDSKLAESKMAVAQVELDRATVRDAEITLSYCSVVSPIDGRISRTAYNVGNLVGESGDTKLTTVVKLDPIYVTFAPAASDLEKIFPLLTKPEPMEVAIRVNDQSPWYPQHGKLDFVDNQITQDTSTIVFRATIDNHKKDLLPGLYVQTRLFLQEIPDAILVPSAAIQRRQTGIQILVAGTDGKLQMHEVELGEEYGNMTHITKGIKPDDLIVAEKIMLLKPGQTIKPKIEKLTEKETGLTDISLTNQK